MFSTWDLVRPRYWYPMSSLEQSMMELDDMADRMFPVRPAFSPFGHNMAMTSPSLLRDVAGFPLNDGDEDDFFRDLPMTMHPRPPEEQQQQRQKKIKPTDTQPEAHGHGLQATDEQSAPAPTSDDSAQDSTNISCGFSSYSFSSSSVLDAKGRRATSTRRRYEDSTGRLKALHEREVDGTRLRKTWSRQHKGDEGVHECVCSSGSAEEFEKMWASTPFGEAQSKSLEDAAKQTKKLEASSNEKTESGEEMEVDKP